jgi:signal transduction histidine kinase/DNA-binding response OmpR family regulator
MTDAILIIDHDQEFAQAIGVYLQRRQFEVLVTGIPQEAEKMFNLHLPEIVLADPELPGSDGLSLIRRLKSSHPQSQVIIVTSADHIEKYMEIFQNEAIGYLTKPVKGISLDIIIKHARDWHSMQKKIDSYTRKLEDLHNAQILYHQLFDEVPCYITVQDRRHRMTATNRLFKQDFGNEIGEYCYKIYKHRESPCPNCPVAATFEDGRHHHTEEVVTSKSGVQYNVLTYTAPIRNEANEITQVMEMATNITQIRQLQDHLTSLGLMLGSMSHSMKGMLTVLDGGIYLLETGIAKKDHSRIQRAYENLRQMVDRIRKMMLDILFFAKSRELEFKKTKVSWIAKTVMDAVKPLARRHGIGLKFASPPESLGSILVDPQWFPASLVNILENAVDACVLDSRKKKHQIYFKVYADANDRICFEIKDNGMGMDRETREKMFTLFFSSKGSKGTGLGLYIVNNVVAAHGGAITVESTPGKGSRFTVSLPRSKTSVKSITR